MLKDNGITFDEAAHKYYYFDVEKMESRELPGITSTIIPWLFPNTYSGIPKEVLAKAAEYGTKVHKAIETGRDNPFLEEEELKAVSDVEGMLTYYMEVIEAHEYLVTDGNFASAIDLVFYDRNRYSDYTLADIKTTSKIHYGNVSAQLSIYAYMFKKCNPEANLNTESGVVIWLPKPKYGCPKWVEVKLAEYEDVEKMIKAYLNKEPADEYRKLFENAKVTDEY